MLEVEASDGAKSSLVRDSLLRLGEVPQIRNRSLEGMYA